MEKVCAICEKRISDDEPATEQYFLGMLFWIHDDNCADKVDDAPQLGGKPWEPQ